jgi:DNA methylase
VDKADQLPKLTPREDQSVTKPGDVWECGDHVLVCGSPLEVSFEDLAATVAFVDPFPAVTAERSEDEISKVLHSSCHMIVAQLCPGARIYWFTEWQNAAILTQAVKPLVGSPTDIIAWIRSDTQDGGLYRSGYDQVAVFTVPDGESVKASAGRRRAHRTNVWHCPGGTRNPDQRSVRKPVKLVIDALQDCSSRGDRILDPFARSGTTMIAAQPAARHGESALSLRATMGR